MPTPSGVKAEFYLSKPCDGGVDHRDVALQKCQAAPNVNDLFSSYAFDVLDDRCVNMATTKCSTYDFLVSKYGLMVQANSMTNECCTV